MKKIYEFYGGKYDNRKMSEETAFIAFRFSGNGFSEDLTEIRENGGLVHREELDNEMQFKGYVGPMYDGERYFVDGEWKYSFDCTEEQIETCKNEDNVCYVLRYETEEVYDRLSR